MEIQRASVKKIHQQFGRGPSKSNIICNLWKQGKCYYNPCKFLHGDSPRLRNNVYVRTSMQSHTSVEFVGPRKGPYDGNNRSLISAARGGAPFDNGTSKKMVMFNHKGKMGENGSEVHSSIQNNISHDGNNRSLISAARGGAPFDNGTSKKMVMFNHNGKMGENGSEVHNSIQNNISHDGTENLPRKLLVTKNALVLTHEGGGSNNISTQGSSVSCTEEVGPKMTKGIERSMALSQNCLQFRPNGSLVLTAESSASEDKTAEKNPGQVCKLWMSDCCVQGDGCRFLHSWCKGDGFSMLAKLSGHSQAVSGIALPAGSDKLYSGSSDGTVRVWDCHTGQCAKVIDLGNKIGSLISEGPWVFVGMPNIVKAWNIETAADFSLNGPDGHVNAMAVALDMLFAGVENGAILVWKGSTENPTPFQLATSLKGHTRAVICLAVGAKKLYSGSMDGTIRVWDLYTLQCLQTLNGHTDAVMSLICWNEYLLSCSLDQTIKVWFAAGGGNFETIYTHNEEHGALALCGMNDAEAKPLLLCSCDDDSVHLYELPSFKERGRIFSKQEVRKIQMGPDGLFFCGDGTGLLTVWKLAEANGGPL